MQDSKENNNNNTVGDSQSPYCQDGIRSTSMMLFIMFIMGLPIIVNMTGFWICIEMQLWKDSEYFRITNKQGFCIYEGYTRFWKCLHIAE